VKSIATWIRECDEAPFERVFQHYPEVCLLNARRQDVPWNQIKGLLLSGGSDISMEYLKQPVPNPALIEDADPVRDAWEFDVLPKALQQKLPILAICRGLQVLNVHLGGTLHLHIPNHDSAKFENIQRLRYSPGAEYNFEKVNSSHHQALNDMGYGLLPEAWAAEDGVVEQAKLSHYPWALGVQYHPERDPLYQPLFDAFVDEVKGLQL